MLSCMFLVNIVCLKYLTALSTFYWILLKFLAYPTQFLNQRFIFLLNCWVIINLWFLLIIIRCIQFLWIHFLFGGGFIITKLYRSSDIKLIKVFKRLPDLFSLKICDMIRKIIYLTTWNSLLIKIVLWNLLSFNSWVKRLGHLHFISLIISTCWSKIIHIWCIIRIVGLSRWHYFMSLIIRI